jgi:hypothetical protein
MSDEMSSLPMGKLMKDDDDKTKEQLIHELTELRSQYPATYRISLPPKSYSSTPKASWKLFGSLFWSWMRI